MSDLAPNSSGAYFSKSAVIASLMLFQFNDFVILNVVLSVIKWSTSMLLPNFYPTYNTNLMSVFNPRPSKRALRRVLF
jgi:hypothetical protein